LGFLGFLPCTMEDGGGILFTEVVFIVATLDVITNS